MLTNLLIATGSLLISLIIFLNFNRMLGWSESTSKRLHQFKLLIGTLTRAYRRYQKVMNQPSFQLHS